MNRKFWIFFFLIALIPLNAHARDEKPLERGRVVSIDGRNLYLEDGRVISLVATYIPRPGEPNFYPELKEGFEKEFLGKEIEYQIVRKAHSRGHYPELDRVVLVKDGYNVNLTLLQEGKAFFVEDYWNKWHLMDYENAWRQAQIDKRGVWGTRPGPQPVYARHWNYVTTYPAHCTEEINRIREKDRLYYYTPMPVTPYRPEWGACSTPAPAAEPAPRMAPAPEAPELPPPAAALPETVKTLPEKDLAPPPALPAAAPAPVPVKAAPVAALPASSTPAPVPVEAKEPEPAAVATESDEAIPDISMPVEAAPEEDTPKDSPAEAAPAGTAADEPAGNAAEQKPAGGDEEGLEQDEAAEGTAAV